MKPMQLFKTGGTVATGVAIVLAGMLINSPRIQANDVEDDHDYRVDKGFQIAPVPLNLMGKDRALVGLGSYLVNAVGDCNGCHSAAEFAAGGNPYFLGQKTKINPATYLGGGVDFGPFPGKGNTHIISRNLTPDETGRPEGGHTFAEFRRIIRTGVDLDHLHPTCSATITTNCLAPPFNGALLQVMPWPVYHNMNDHDLRAIYEYLRAIPCVAGEPAPSPRHHDCK